MPIDLYYTARSSQCQAIQMVAAALNIKLNLIPCNLLAGEQFRPEFMAINPQHTTPTLHDNGFALWETRAILVYLAEKYGGANSTLYPSRGDAQRRALVNQRLDFDMCSMYAAFDRCYYSTFFYGTLPAADELRKVDAAFGILDGFLANGAQFVVPGDALTVADIALFATVSLFDMMGHDFRRFANVGDWYERLGRSIPGKEINVAGMKLARLFVDTIRISNENAME